MKRNYLYLLVPFILPVAFSHAMKTLSVIPYERKDDAKKPDEITLELELRFMTAYDPSHATDYKSEEMEVCFGQRMKHSKCLLVCCRPALRADIQHRKVEKNYKNNFPPYKIRSGVIVERYGLPYSLPYSLLKNKKDGDTVVVELFAETEHPLKVTYECKHLGCPRIVNEQGRATRRETATIPFEQQLALLLAELKQKTQRECDEQYWNNLENSVIV